ncbi:MAG: substrate-binding domain-containing protein, partial [Bifidobacteriaceae bacterium]|nr:substrate-binding domain-containing protein [Bifidobacteriaceae bacterium]
TDDDPRRQAEYLQVLADQSAAGAILNPASAAGADISALSAHGIPVVSLEMDLAAAADSVHCDDAAGARLATRHLAEAGAGRIACVTGGAETPSARERLAGYRQVISELGFPVRPEFIAHTDYREAQGEAAVRRMFDFEDPPDALFAANNRLVIGALRALRALGRRVPEDVMVAGFDELPWMDLIEPPVTTIAQHSYEIGATAAEMLIERIDGYDGPARRVAIPPTLTVRASSRG